MHVFNNLSHAHILLTILALMSNQSCPLSPRKNTSLVYPKLPWIAKSFPMRLMAIPCPAPSSQCRTRKHHCPCRLNTLVVSGTAPTLATTPYARFVAKDTRKSRIIPTCCALLCMNVASQLLWPCSYLPAAAQAALLQAPSPATLTPGHLQHANSYCTKGQGALSPCNCPCPSC